MAGILGVRARGHAARIQGQASSVRGCGRRYRAGRGRRLCAGRVRASAGRRKGHMMIGADLRVPHDGERRAAGLVVRGLVG
jgi:hypothetical protein